MRIWGADARGRRAVERFRGVSSLAGGLLIFLFLCSAALEDPESDIGLCGWCLVGFSILLVLLTLPLSIWMCIKVPPLSPKKNKKNPVPYVLLCCPV